MMMKNLKNNTFYEVVKLKIFVKKKKQTKTNERNFTGKKNS